MAAREGKQVISDTDAAVPPNLWNLARENFDRELEGLRLSVRLDESQAMEQM